MAQWDASAAILLPLGISMQRGIVYFLLFVVAVVVGLLLWWQDSAPIDPPVAPVAEPASPPPAGVERGPAGAQVVEPHAVRPVAPPPPGVPHVHVEVVSRERFVAPPPPRAEALLLADRRTLPTTLLAGAGAGFDAPADAAGSALAAIQLGANTLLRQIVVVPGQIAQPTLGATLVVSGTVRDATTLRPLVGASVWFGELLPDGSRRDVQTNEDGAFTADVLAGSGVPFVVRMPGFAAHWRAIQVAAPMGPCDVILQPACTLDVQVVGAAMAMQDARVFVLPMPQGPVATELTTWPFFCQALTDGIALDERGRATLDELPRAGALGVVVRHPLAALAVHPVALKGERARAMVPMQYLPDTGRGRVVDADGNPLGGVAMWAHAPGSSLTPGASQRLLPPHLEALGTRASRSRADGTFALGIRDGDLVSLRATGFAGRDVAVATLARDGEVRLPRWSGGEVQFTLQPPAAGAAWYASTNLSGGLQAELAADATWRVSLPHAGSFDFVLTTRVGDSVVATRTDRDVMVTGPIDLAAPSSVR